MPLCNFTTLPSSVVRKVLVLRPSSSNLRLESSTPNPEQRARTRQTRLSRIKRRVKARLSLLSLNTTSTTSTLTATTISTESESEPPSATKSEFVVHNENSIIQSRRARFLSCPTLSFSSPSSDAEMSMPPGQDTDEFARAHRDAEIPFPTRILNWNELAEAARTNNTENLQRRYSSPLMPPPRHQSRLYESQDPNEHAHRTSVDSSADRWPDFEQTSSTGREIF
ncbi:hypothetical protein NM688_g5192 [Phlebia brevispora]|uniref:Uncharacterized protein n=1 Tax=Phlebia brevispora TaxID=194682 RepID=A0ACC1SZ74_9APHY|nr:hypothetical protein NM688_g5192 [Phlebia brevispora]